MQYVAVGLIVAVPDGVDPSCVMKAIPMLSASRDHERIAGEIFDKKPKPDDVQRAFNAIGESHGRSLPEFIRVLELKP